MTSEPSHMDVIVFMEWESNKDYPGGFQVTVLSPIEGLLTMTTKVTSHSLTVPYNSEFTVFLKGSNCTGNGTELTKTFHFGKHDMNKNIIHNHIITQ